MTTTMTAEARAFAAAVRAELADLPEDDAAELLEDVEQHLAEADAEGRLPELGSPAAYAAELRAAAGLPPRGGGDAWAPLRTARRWVARLTATRAYTEVRAFAPELRPGWWVARGYLAVVALAFWTHHSLREVVPIPHVSGNVLLGVGATVAAVVASVAWGRRRASYGRVPRALTIAANALTVVVALAVLDNAANRSYSSYHYLPASFPPEGLHGPFGQIDDIYPYDDQGRPLDGIRLYDRSGNALAPQVCGSFCPRLSFPLHDDPRLPIAPGSDYRMNTAPTQEPAVSVTPTAATPTPTPTPRK